MAICSVVPACGQVLRRLRAEALRRAGVVAAYRKVRLTPQDFGSLHLALFEQPAKDHFPNTLLVISDACIRQYLRL